MTISRHYPVFLSLLLSSAAAFSAPFASMPSVAPLGKSFLVTGGGFAPGAVVTVRIAGPGREIAMDASQAAADGTFKHSLLVPKSGAYTVDLLTGADSAPAVSMKINVVK